MAKTRRRKINRSPRAIFKNSEARVVENGFRVQIAGHRTAEGSTMVLSAKATPVFVGRQYTGVNRGKIYPYAGKKRGGDPKGLIATLKKAVMT